MRCLIYSRPISGPIRTSRLQAAVAVGKKASRRSALSSPLALGEAVRSARWGRKPIRISRLPPFLEASPYRARASRPLPKGEGSVVNYLCFNFAFDALNLALEPLNLGRNRVLNDLFERLVNV